MPTPEGDQDPRELGAERKRTRVRSFEGSTRLTGGDDVAQHTGVGTQWFIDEIRNRALARQTKTLVRVAWAIGILTAANVGLVALTLFE